MKTKAFYLVTKITVAVVLVAILVFEAKASGNANIKMVPYAPERAIIELSNNSDLNSELTIENAAGNVVYYKEGKITEDNYSKKFDFTHLTDGIYKVTVTNNNGKNEVYFNVEGNKISVNNDLNLNKPYVEIKDNVLKLSMLNNKLGEVSLILSNEDGVVYKKSLGTDFNISAGFNLSNLDHGDYAINITDGVNTYTYSYNK